MSFESDKGEGLRRMFAGLAADDARACAYYLSRYLKQAALFSDYEKDIFDDDSQSVPSEFVKQCTLRMVDYIEFAQGAKAAEFDDETYASWADDVDEIENALENEPSPEAMARATQFLSSMVLPDSKDHQV